MAAGRSAGRDKADLLPAFAPLPGGSANVFTRALGLPRTRWTRWGSDRLAGVRAGAPRRARAGHGPVLRLQRRLGLDAEVVRAVEAQRALGRPATPGLYMRMAVRQFYRVTDRRNAALTLYRDGPPAGRAGVPGHRVQHRAVDLRRRRPVHTSRQASFDTGLDVIALRTLRTPGMIRASRQMLSRADRPLRGRHLISLHDESGVRVEATRPVAFQVTGSTWENTIGAV